MTDLPRHLSKEELEAVVAGSGNLKSVHAGAATQVYAATAPELDGRGGLYLEHCQVASIRRDQDSGPGGLAPHAAFWSCSSRAT